MRVTPLILVAFALACAPPRSHEAALRLEKLAAERRNLEATFDQLEDRLVVNQARVRFWRELRVRHESVSAIACASQDEHAQEMASHFLAPEPSRRARVAAISTAAASRVPAVAGVGAGSPR